MSKDQPRVTLPIHILPIGEQWDCTGCGLCCRGNVVPLDEDDLRKLREQDWDNHPDFRGIQTVVRSGLRASYRLAQREDGRCVFQMEDGLCRIHKEYGLEAKPLICQMYPLQLVPLQNQAVLTLRRSCPTAAADRGKPLKSYLKAAKYLGTQRHLLISPKPPRITRNRAATWSQSLRVMEGIGSLINDERFPLVRRIIHALNFCRLLESCHFHRVQEVEFGELIDILVESAPQETGALFQERTPPSRSGAVMFRLAVAEYLRLHPKCVLRETWHERFRLVPIVMKMVFGRGTLPRFHRDLPVATFAELEEPLGHLPEEVQRPINRYFEVNATAKQYAVACRPTWSIIESFRALALAYSVALWILRLCSEGNEPSVETAIDIVTLIDRGQGYAPLESRHHRKRIRTLAQLDQLRRLAVWYAR